MGALRRPQQWEAPKPNPQGSAAEARKERHYPRWIVVSGLIFYCAAVWVLVIAAGSWGVELMRTATAQP